MSTLIINRQPKAPIMYARIGVVIDGKRYLHVCRRDADGVEFDEWTRLLPSSKPMTVVPNIGGDLDDEYLKDIVQSVEGRKAGKWLYKVDITTRYHEFNAMRAAELRGERQFAMNTKKEEA